MKLSCFRTNMMMSTIAAAQSATATETSTQCEGAAAANKTSANSNESWNTPWTAVQATDEWLQQRLARKRASKGALVSGGGGGGGGGGGKQQRVERVAERICFVVCVMERKLSQSRSMTRLGLSVNTSNIMLYHAVVAVPNLRFSLRASQSSTSSR